MLASGQRQVVERQVRNQPPQGLSAQRRRELAGGLGQAGDAGQRRVDLDIKPRPHRNLGGDAAVGAEGMGEHHLGRRPGRLEVEIDER